MSTGFLWLPLVAVALHLVEEFVWPGGFTEWYRHYPPDRVTKVSTQFIVLINIAFVALALSPPLIGATPRGFAMWMVVAAVAAANAIFHLIAVARTRQYSPGVVTGVAAYLPLAVIGGAYLTRLHLISTGTLLEAIFMGVAYHVWSAWNHNRHAVTT